MGFSDLFKNVAKGYGHIFDQVNPFDHGKTFNQPLTDDQRLQASLANNRSVTNGGDTEYIPNGLIGNRPNPAHLQMSNGNGVPLLTNPSTQGFQRFSGNIPLLQISNGLPQVQGSYNGTVSPDEQFSQIPNYSNGNLGGSYLQLQRGGDSLQYGDAWGPEQLYQRQLQHPTLRRNF